MIRERQKENLSNKLRETIKGKTEKKNLVVLCIGTDRVIGDAFGPLVGEKLTKLLGKREDITILGSLQEPLHYENLQERLQIVQDKASYLIAVDAAIAKEELIGKIILEEKGLMLGKGIRQTRREIGDISIKGIVSKDVKIPEINFMLLQQVPLGFVLNMAEKTAEEIYKGIH